MNPQQTIIRPQVGGEHTSFAQIMAHRGLLVNLVRKELRVRFNSTKLGILWPIVRPLAMVILITTFRTAPSTNDKLIPVDLNLYAGLILWFFLSDTVMQTAGAVRSDAGVITKVFYPRVLSPLSQMLANFCELIICMIPIPFMMVYHRHLPSPMVFALPLFLISAAGIALGLGLSLSGWILRHRDAERMLGIILYVLLFASPVFFMPGKLNETINPMLYINPATPVIQGMRDIFSNGPAGVAWFNLGAATVAALLFLAIGMTTFKRIQNTLVELL